MKLVLLLMTVLVGFAAHADEGDSNYFGGGFHLGVGYNFVNYEQRISDTGTDFTTDASDIRFLYLSFMSRWNENLAFLLYGSLGTVTFHDSPSGAAQESHSSLTGDANAEARITFGSHSEREDWVPTYILGINADYLPLVRAPKSLAAGYEYGLVPVVSPDVGVTTTMWGSASAWRNTIRFGVPLVSGSGMKVRSGYWATAVTSYTFGITSNFSMGVEGVISYLSLKLSETSQVTNLDVDHTITEFSVGPRIFFNLGF